MIGISYSSRKTYHIRQPTALLRSDLFFFSILGFRNSGLQELVRNKPFALTISRTDSPKLESGKAATGA